MISAFGDHWKGAGLFSWALDNLKMLEILLLNIAIFRAFVDKNNDNILAF
jgi:uncharacterized membrane protein